jgi:succinate-acetate transporter protein
MAFLFYHITTLAAKFFVVMETDIRMIKYLLIILAVSFLFVCVAEAQSNKPLITVKAIPSSPLAEQNRGEFLLSDQHLPKEI